MVPNLYVMDLPQVKSEQGKELLKAEYLRFKESVEKLTGVEITVDRLKKGIGIVNNKERPCTGSRSCGAPRRAPSPVWTVSW